jgi:pheromone shutdown protein TraB
LNVIETLRDGVVVVGTAHVSATSVAEVESTIRAQRPRKVLVELDPARLKALQDPDAWLNTDIFRILREKKHHMFLLQLYLAAMQAQMGRDTGVAPGSELLRAVQVADEVGAEVVLIDRDVGITLRRGFGAMGFWARLRLFWKFWTQLLTPAEEGPEPTVEDLLKNDAITQMTEEFAKFAPVIKTALIDERDDFMASHIVEQARLAGLEGPAAADAATRGAAARPRGIVAVVGAGHMAGIKARLADPARIPERALLLQPPPRRFPLAMVLGLALPLALAVWLGYLALHGHAEQVVGFLYLWVFLHMALAGLGALLARGHPAAILTGALAAPITSILPVGVKSGWLAGLVQAKLRTPKVKDFQAIKHIQTFGQFWGNGIVKILTVTSLTILGSEAASIVAGILFVKGGL